MRQTHLAGEKLFVDWAGDTMPVFDPTTGEEHRAHIFVAALGASNYTYAEARWTETLPDWIGAHVNAFAAIGGVSKALVPDNLKAGITKPSRYEPGINRTYPLHALGRAILFEAANHSAPDDRRALGIGTLPAATTVET
jgi:transposase